MSFFSKLRDRLTKSSSKIGAGLDEIVAEAPAPARQPRLLGRQVIGGGVGHQAVYHGGGSGLLHQRRYQLGAQALTLPARHNRGVYFGLP